MIYTRNTRSLCTTQCSQWPTAFTTCWRSIPKPRLRASATLWVIHRTKEERSLLFESILNVTFDGMSGKVSFKPGVGDRVPAKMEIVNIYVCASFF